MATTNGPSAVIQNIKIPALIAGVSRPVESPPYHRTNMVSTWESLSEFGCI